jgi:hypothetical protein
VARGDLAWVASHSNGGEELPAAGGAAVIRPDRILNEAFGD